METTSSAAGDASASAAASATPGADATSGSGATARGESLSATDADTLDAELEAIEGELDRLSLPSDSDFNDIESGLK